MAAGAVEAAITSVKAKAGAYFDGLNDKVTFTSIPLPQFTVSFWAMTKSFPGGSWGMFMGDVGDYLGKLSGGGAIRMELNGTTSVFGSPAMALETWHHFVYWSNGVITRAYFDGVQSGADVANVEPLTLDKIGQGQANWHNATISDVCVWNVPLTPTQCTDIYAGTKDRTNLIAEWLLRDDYNDTLGNYNGTNSGSRLAAMEEDIAAQIKTNRVGINDHQMLAIAGNNQVINVNVEE